MKTKMLGAVVINEDRCKGCSECVVACPVDALEITGLKINANGYAYVQPSAKADCCTGCTSCAVACPDGCITVYRKKVTVDDAVKDRKEAEV